MNEYRHLEVLPGGGDPEHRHENGDGEVPCPTCRGLGRVPKPRRSPPRTPDRPSGPKNFQLHIPTSTQPDGHDDLQEAVAAAEQLLIDAGYFDRRPVHYWTILYTLVHFLQTFDPVLARREREGA